MKQSYPRLIADIGGTNARFCIETGPYKYDHTKIFSCKDFHTLANCINGYTQSIGLADQISSAAIALPTPIVDDTIFMVNSPWQTFSQKTTRQEVRIKNLIFLNDWHALALAVPYIPKSSLMRVGGTNEPDITKPVAVIGPGTGLGMATLIRHPSGEYFAIPAEGGRSSFPPVNEEEVELWKFVHKRFNHVSAERFLSGPGLQLIYEGFCSLHDITIDTLPSPAEIVKLAMDGSNWTCKQTLDTFCRMLGTVASNLAVTVTSFGGVYIGGGIVPKIFDYFIKSDFRGRFEDKGRYRPFLVKMPVFVIMHENPAFLGASYALETYLTKNYIP